MKLKQAKSRKFIAIHMAIIISIIIVAVILNSTYGFITEQCDEVSLGYYNCHDGFNFIAGDTATPLNQQSSVTEHLEFEEKVADIEFVLHQFELIDMPFFNFTVEISDDVALRQLMLLTINDLLKAFKQDNPGVTVETYKQQNEKLLLTVKLITPESRGGFSQKAILI